MQKKRARLVKVGARDAATALRVIRDSLTVLHLEAINDTKLIPYNDKDLQLLTKVKGDISDIIGRIDDWDEVPF